MISWLFLAVSLWGAAFTWNAIFPNPRGMRRSMLSFAAGWLTSELALHHVAWQAIATAVFALLGAFDSWPGQLGLAITLVSWGGLGFAQFRASQAANIVERALAEAFGAESLDALAPELASRLSGLEWRRVVQPFPIRSALVERTRDVVYGRARGIDLTLDVYRHRDHPTGCPVLFQIHGGGWIGGRKDDQALPLMYQLADHGWVCVSANYRLSPHATFPEHLVDVKRALFEAIQQAKRGLERELEIGREIQAGFLPEQLPHLPGWEIAARFQAAREVAGDFYDAFPLAGGDRVVLVLGDVCGKGVGAALFMTLFRSLIRASAHLIYSTGYAEGTAAPLDDMSTLKNMVTLTNNYVARTHYRASMFASLFLGVLNPVTGSLIYLNGGHESPQILGAEGVKAALEPTGPVVGLFADMDFKIRQVHLEPGDTLYAFTDGVIDAQNSAGEMFSREKLHSLLACPVASVAALLDLIETALNTHVAGANQYDDITMLAVQRISDR